MPSLEYDRPRNSAHLEALAQAYLKLDRLTNTGVTIGFHAPRGTGKDTLARALARVLKGRGVVCAFADPLYVALAVLTGLRVEFLRDPENKNRPLTEDDTKVTSLWGKTIREMLEKLGTEYCRDVIHPAHFVEMKRVLLKYDTSSFVWPLITDVRFPNETALCDVVVELRREGDIGYSEEHRSRKRLPVHLIDSTYQIPPGDFSVEAVCTFVDWLEVVTTHALYLQSRDARAQWVITNDAGGFQ